MILYQLSSSDMGGSQVFDSLEDVIDHIREFLGNITGSVGDSIRVEVVRMSKSKYNNLPEFEG